MATVASVARSVKPAREPHGVCRLTLVINATAYAVRPVRSDWHARAWSLRKADGTVYHLAAGEHGPECDCPDATFRDRPCKHIRSMQATGLL
jgi:hypothetical protein